MVAYRHTGTLPVQVVWREHAEVTAFPAEEGRSILGIRLPETAVLQWQTPRHPRGIYEIRTRSRARVWLAAQDTMPNEPATALIYHWLGAPRGHRHPRRVALVVPVTAIDLKRLNDSAPLRITREGIVRTLLIPAETCIDRQAPATDCVMNAAFLLWVTPGENPKGVAFAAWSHPDYWYPCEHAVPGRA